MIKLTQENFSKKTNGVTQGTFKYSYGSTNKVCYILEAGEYELGEDITLNGNPIIINDNVTINLGNHTLKRDNPAGSGVTEYNAICVQSGGNLTVNADSNGKIVSSTNYPYRYVTATNMSLIRLEGTGSLTMNGGTIETNRIGLCVDSTGTVDISQ